jgi:hypothetical protein
LEQSPDPRRLSNKAANRKKTRERSLRIIHNSILSGFRELVVKFFDKAHAGNTEMILPVRTSMSVTEAVRPPMRPVGPSGHFSDGFVRHRSALFHGRLRASPK